MEYKQLGNTGLLVSELCFGTMTFSGKGFWKAIGQVRQQDANNLVARALDAGVLYHRRTGPGAGTGTAPAGSEDGSAGLESAGGGLTLGEIFSRGQRTRERTPGEFRFSTGGEKTSFQRSGCDAGDR